MISFVVPAHNEEAFLGRTLQAIHDSARVVGQPYETIVVDDASTDGTAEIAAQNQARLLKVTHRQIAATRNSGARAARGNRLFFVDADTTINPEVVLSALRCMDNGAVGGGASIKFNDQVPLYGRLMVWSFRWLAWLFGITGGAFMFCTREAFAATGGFDERLFGGEDAALCYALKRQGRFVVLWQPVCTSGRRLRGVRGLKSLAAFVRLGFSPGTLSRRTSAVKIWYDSNRQEPDSVSDRLAAQVINLVLLSAVLVAITDPIWRFIPGSPAMNASVLGDVRYAINVLLCHLGLVFWPCTYFILHQVLRERRWQERLKLLALASLCLCAAGNLSYDVIRFWVQTIHWLTTS